jgi:hypothetical protein
MNFVVHNNTQQNINSIKDNALLLVGGTMKGAIVQPFEPVNAEDLVNKMYVDIYRQPPNVPDATPTTKGVVQLAGDLTGAASAPFIGNKKITNVKIAPGEALTLKGTGDEGLVADISLGKELKIEGSILNVNSIALSGYFLSLSGGTMKGPIVQPAAPINSSDVVNKSYVDGQTTVDATAIVKGKLRLAGDLSGTADAPLVAANAITNHKLANLNGPGQLKGSGSDAATAVDISLGSRLYMQGSTLNVIEDEAYVPVSFTGGITYPTVTGLDSNTLVYSEKTTAYVRYTVEGVSRQEIWYLEQDSYEPKWVNGSNQQVTYVAIVPEYEKKILKVVEYSSYRSFPVYEAAEIVFYTIVTRNVESGVFTSIVSYMQGYGGIEYADKINMFFNGSVALNHVSYALTPETLNFKDVVGPYFHLNRGSSKNAGRNYLNDKFSTFVTLYDAEVQGASEQMTVAVAGRGSEGDEGKQFYRETGVKARILGSCTSVIFERFDANSINDYEPVKEDHWTYYKLSVFPGSRVTVVKPHNEGHFTTADEALATTHIYDRVPYRNFDRWIPTIFVGYMALKGSFNFDASWEKNADMFSFYDYNKVRIG